MVKTFLKGILNSDFGRCHRWVTGGVVGWWGVVVGEISLVLRLDAATSPGLL